MKGGQAVSFEQDPNERADISGSDFAQMCDEMKQLRAERDALLADKERLDWLETKRLPLIPCFGIAPPMGSDLPFSFDGWVIRSDADEPKPLRAAIDAARKENL